MSLLLDGLELPDGLVWINEYDWTPTAQSQSRTLTGSLVIETAQKVGGRPMTLSRFWITRAVLNQLTAKLAITTPLLLTLQDGRVFTVRFANEDGKPIDAKPVFEYTVMSDDEPYNLTLNLLIMES